MLYRYDFKLTEDQLETVRRRFPQVDLHVADHDAAGDSLLGDAEVIVGWPTPKMLQACRELRWLHVPSVGADLYKRNDGVLPRGVILTNSRGAFDVPGAEHVLALVFSLARRIDEYVRQGEKRRWHRFPPLFEVAGCTVGVVGMGNIGQEIGRRFKGMGCRVLGVRRRPPGGDVPYADAVYGLDGLAEVVCSADILVMVLPRTPHTEGLLSRDLIRRMREKAIFINVGRGETVDEEALIEALKDGRIAAAGLDVTAVEPLPSTSPLWDLPNVIITAHSMGRSPNNNRRRLSIFCENLDKYLAGEAPTTVVDVDRGY